MTDGLSPKFLNTRELAARWGVSKGTLKQWRCEGQGPSYLKFGTRLVRYRLEDIVAFEAQGLREADEDLANEIYKIPPSETPNISKLRAHVKRLKK